MPRKFLMLAASLFVMLPAAGQAQQISSMQQCLTSADCVMTENRCGTRCEATPINRAYLDEFRNIAGMCSIEIQTGAVCSMPMTLQPSCVAGVCTVQTAQIISPQPVIIAVPPAAGTEFRTTARTATEELRVIVPADDREGWFTAYDLPPELVEMDRLGQVYVTTERQVYLVE